jgi:hypothetical protein
MVFLLSMASWATSNSSTIRISSDGSSGDGGRELGGGEERQELIWNLKEWSRRPERHTIDDTIDVDTSQVPTVGVPCSAQLEAHMMLC